MPVAGDAVEQTSNPFCNPFRAALSRNIGITKLRKLQIRIRLEIVETSSLILVVRVLHIAGFPDYHSLDLVLRPPHQPCVLSLSEKLFYARFAAAAFAEQINCASLNGGRGLFADDVESRD